MLRVIERAFDVNVLTKYLLSDVANLDVNIYYY